MEYKSPKSFRVVDYVISPEKREIKHEATGISFRFNHSRGLAMLSRPERNFEEEMHALGAAINRGPAKSLPKVFRIRSSSPCSA
jgi:hypothetical protein